MINEKLMALDGYARGIDTSETVVDLTQEYKNDLAAEEMFKVDILNKIEITTEEIDTAISKKQIELKIKWLYADSKNKVNNFLEKLREGISYDSLFTIQISDSVKLDERSMNIDRFKLEQQNPLLAKIVDSLKAGEVSIPIHVDDGWYIVKLENMIENKITSETEYEKLKQESVNALKKIKLDKLSDEYVTELMLSENPIIKRNSFNLLRSYLGSYVLPSSKYNGWNLSKKLNEALININSSNENNYGNEVLIETKNNKINLREFIIWFRNRSDYVKLNENDLQNFSLSLENLVWRMVRDKLLSNLAVTRGFDKREEVVKQSNWWKDKIISSAVKNEIVNSVFLGDNENKIDDDSIEANNNDKLNKEFNKKLLRKILNLKQKYSINIYQDALNNISVSDENNPKAVEVYTVKKGGLIPRTPYPTIDYDWINWE